MFKQLVGDTCVIRQGGVFKPADLFSWDGGLYAKVGNGYVRLRENGTTSKDGVEFVHIEINHEMFRDRHGRVCLEARSDTVPLVQAPPGSEVPLLTAPPL